MPGGGEREEYMGPDDSTIGLPRPGLPRYPLPDEVDGGAGSGTGMDMGGGLAAARVWRNDCLLF
jgi:hypothetical protein